MAPELTRKVAIITGGASGIGLATAQTFLSAGVAGLTLIDLSSDNLALALASFSLEDQRRVLTVTADVSDETPVANYVKQTVDRFGKLDISIQAAGIIHVRWPVQDLNVEVYERIFNVNVRGSFLGLKHSARAMLASPSVGKDCSIVLISSSAGSNGFPLGSIYAASKFAIRGLALSAAAELGAAGIRVNTVAPGPVETPMLDLTPKELWAGFDTQAMLGRPGKPHEIAAGILFLASDASSLMTGSLVKMDGGTCRFA